jgi:hypothetical protein
MRDFWTVIDLHGNRVQRAGEYNIGAHPVHGGGAVWRYGADGDGQYSLLAIAGDTFLNAESTLRLRQGNADRMHIDASVVIDVNLAINGASALYWPSYGGGWYMQDTTWIRAYGNKNIYTAGNMQADGSVSTGTMNTIYAQATQYKFNGVGDTDTWIDNPADGYIRFVVNGAVAFQVGAPWGALGIEYANGYTGGLRVYSAADPNHGIRYQPAVGGPEIDGYSGVRIWVVSGGQPFDFGADGVARDNYGWTTFSSIKLKENVKDLSAERAMEMITRLRPVTYDMRDGSHDDQIGFIAEWTQPVVPHAVAPETDNGIGAAIDYGRFTPVLTKAMQHLLARMDELDTRLTQVETP